MSHLHDSDASFPRRFLPDNNVSYLPFASPLFSYSDRDPRSTLWWGELEPWMDDEYAKQVCRIMNWEPISIKVPRPPPDTVTGHQSNNPGYCFLTFASQSQGALVLAQVQYGAIMPNSSKPFVLNWATSVPPTPPAPSMSLPPPRNLHHQPSPSQSQPFIKEYSIFVGDLAPEVSNSDLVAVFRNPVLGLRNDREPRFIRPFLSCKSAKIMLDPVTGVSRGYGFVRFTDEADQQRALIEMHGLYCLSRPMRISPATAKYKSAMTSSSSAEFGGLLQEADGTPRTEQSPPPSNVQSHSVSTPLASSSATSPSTPGEDVHSHAKSTNNKSLSPSNSISSFAAEYKQATSSQKYVISEESWKHHAQARAILSNLIGPNGEQLSSSDPYNTTVFVGGLSPLISEDTLRTFFVPFGEIHYVKVPAGKNCGFVQFMRKPDAERAIEKMQGFPIGGSRIRLSWGRSQYKAAQAAAQAAQTAALQSQPGPPHVSQPTPSHPPSLHTPSSHTPPISPDQAVELVQRFGLTRYLNQPYLPSPLEVPNTRYMSDLAPPPALYEPESSLIEQYLSRQGSIDVDLLGSDFFNSFAPFSMEAELYTGSQEHQSDNNGSSSFERRPQDAVAGLGPIQKSPPTKKSPTGQIEESMQDVSGTLGSLDLDNHRRMTSWQNLSRTLPPSLK